MKKVIFSIAFIFVFTFVLTASQVFACSCIESIGESIDEKVKNGYENAKLVFTAKVLQVKKHSNSYSVVVTLKVEKAWKGLLTSNKILIQTGRGGGDCGYRFEVGKNYLVYAYGEKRKFSTNNCTRTNLALNNQDILILDKIIKPKSFPK